jgi:hypothetical protein
LAKIAKYLHTYLYCPDTSFFVSLFFVFFFFPPWLPDFSCYTKPKPEKMYQMNTKCIKWSKSIQTLSNLRPSKIYPNWDFCFENKTSGNPASRAGFCLLVRGICDERNKNLIRNVFGAATAASAAAATYAVKPSSIDRILGNGSTPT